MLDGDAEEEGGGPCLQVFLVPDGGGDFVTQVDVEFLVVAGLLEIDVADGAKGEFEFADAAEFDVGVVAGIGFLLLFFAQAFFESEDVGVAFGVLDDVEFAEIEAGLVKAKATRGACAIHTDEEFGDVEHGTFVETGRVMEREAGDAHGGVKEVEVE